MSCCELIATQALSNQPRVLVGKRVLSHNLTAFLCVHESHEDWLSVANKMRSHLHQEASLARRGVITSHALASAATQIEVGRSRPCDNAYARPWSPPLRSHLRDAHAKHIEVGRSPLTRPRSPPLRWHLPHAHERQWSPPLRWPMQSHGHHPCVGICAMPMRSRSSLISSWGSMYLQATSSAWSKSVLLSTECDTHTSSHVLVWLQV